MSVIWRRGAKPGPDRPVASVERDPAGHLRDIEIDQTPVRSDLRVERDMSLKILRMGHVSQGLFQHEANVVNRHTFSLAHLGPTTRAAAIVIL